MKANTPKGKSKESFTVLLSVFCGAQTPIAFPRKTFSSRLETLRVCGCGMHVALSPHLSPMQRAWSEGLPWLLLVGVQVPGQLLKRKHSLRESAPTQISKKGVKGPISFLSVAPFLGWVYRGANRNNHQEIGFLYLEIHQGAVPADCPSFLGHRKK